MAAQFIGAAQRPSSGSHRPNFRAPDSNKAAYSNKVQPQPDTWQGPQLNFQQPSVSQQQSSHAAANSNSLLGPDLGRVSA